jgi:hypothetical protein
MTQQQLSRALVKQRIQDGDRVFLATNRTYKPETNDHRQCWPKCVAAIESSKGRGVMYSTLKAIGGSNKDYAAYLIGQLQVLRCPALEQRIGLIDDS